MNRTRNFHRNGGRNLYVKHLDYKIDDNILRKLFAPFGPITSARVMLHNGHSKGFGFVCYVKLEDALKAIDEMNGIMICAKTLYVAMAQRRSDREADLYCQYKRNLAMKNKQMIQDMAQETTSKSVSPEDIITALFQDNLQFTDDPKLQYKQFVDDPKDMDDIPAEVKAAINYHSDDLFAQNKCIFDTVGQISSFDFIGNPLSKPKNIWAPTVWDNIPPHPFN